MNWRFLLRLTGAALLLIGVFLPRDWYDALPWDPGLPTQPIRGVTLLQLALVLEGTVLVWWSWRTRLTRALQPEELPGLGVWSDDGGLDATRARWAIAAITLLALALRLFHVTSDLWLDEISPIMDYGTVPVLNVITSYQRSNNHLLNTLLVKGSIALFGEHEWSVRLPAVLLGTATIPALYWSARRVMPRLPALGGALLLAVSYHHIFFSQNARGYAGYMLFGVLSSGLLVEGLRQDRGRTWVLYVLTLTLGFSIQLLTVFVAAAHGLVGLVALVQVRRRGGAALPLLGRLAGVFTAAGLLAFMMYASVIPQAMIVARTTYTSASTGFQPGSLEFLQEMIRGLSAGFGTGLLFGVIPFLALGALGFVVLALRNWAWAFALVFPALVTATFLLVRGFTFSPRFFLLGLPLAIVCAVQGLWSVSEFATRRSANAPRLASRTASALVLLLCAASALSLGAYYRHPKQDYRGAIREVESRRKQGDAVIVFGVAEKGTRYYTQRLGVPANAGYIYVRSEAAIDSVLASDPTRGVLMIATFARELRMNHPALYQRARNEWPSPRIFEGTVGDGALLVFELRP